MDSKNLNIFSKSLRCNTSQTVALIKTLLVSVHQRSLSEDERFETTVKLATDLQFLSQLCEFSSPSGLKKRHMLSEDLLGRTCMSSLADVAFRSRKDSRVASQFRAILNQYGIPKGLPGLDQAKLWLLKVGSGLVPTLAVTLFHFFLKQEMKLVIRSSRFDELNAYLKRRKKNGVKVNLSHLGESVLGDMEATHHLQAILNLLANPKIKHLSIKLSSLMPLMSHVAWLDQLQMGKTKLRIVYRAAMTHRVESNGKKSHKMVHLDMENSSSLELTVQTFKNVMDEPEFLKLSAGIALQAYLPESFEVLQDLTKWAKERASRGGAPIRVRIVKGANLGMERVEASVKGWCQAPFLLKVETDANFKRMLAFSLKLENAKIVRIGIGSHNVFDISFALVLASENGAQKYLDIEMLEGMSPSLFDALRKFSERCLLYCPIADPDAFSNAIAYLIRRFDENSGPEHFLREGAFLKPDHPKWLEQVKKFKRSFDLAFRVSSKSRRSQNRSFPSTTYSDSFVNDPSTDWTCPGNRPWIGNLVVPPMLEKITEIPLVVGGKEITEGVYWEMGTDPSCPEKSFYKVAYAAEFHIELALDTAQKARGFWCAQELHDRCKLLGKVADLMRINRADLIRALIQDTGKPIEEADGEVCEAIDFLEYYRRSVHDCLNYVGMEASPLGTVLVLAPWNFGCAIPTGCIAASLVTGNTVIFKPAPEASFVGYKVVQIFWEAGISKEVLQYVNCIEDPLGSMMIKDSRISAVMLTGSTQTALKFRSLRPRLPLIAETGGKNSIIVTAMADLDLAVKNIIKSAFSYSGQKCSAASLLICEDEVYDDPIFRRKLADAVNSLEVGSAWYAKTQVGPLILEPQGSLLKALTSLENGQRWLVEPHPDPHNPRLWSPGVKEGIEVGSFMHQTECFGPVLGMMRARNLSDAIEKANATPYGLTAGLESLDPREHELWKNKIQAGNLYINREITGAIVQRQPFGGTKASSFGKGFKAGGPNYLLQLLKISSCVDVEDIKMGESKRNGFGSYEFWARRFRTPYDVSQILGQDNFSYWVPLSRVTLRLSASDSTRHLLQIVVSAVLCGTFIEISYGDDQQHLTSQLGQLLDQEFKCPWPWAKKKFSYRFLRESDFQITERIRSGEINFIRSVGPVSDAICDTLGLSIVNIFEGDPKESGRIECLNYMREVSLSHNYHRYGNLGAREDEVRSPQSNPILTNIRQKTIVYFDGLCHVCYRKVDHYKVMQGAENIVFQDITAPDFDPVSHGLDPVAIHKNLHVRDNSGQVRVGVDGFIAIWNELPSTRFISPIASFGPVHFILRVGYFFFTKVRRFLPRKSCHDSPYCDLSSINKS